MLTERTFLIYLVGWYWSERGSDDCGADTGQTQDRGPDHQEPPGHLHRLATETSSTHIVTIVILKTN